jgi:hypothetical protein
MEVSCQLLALAALSTEKESPVFVVKEAEWVPVLVRMQWRRESFLSFPGIKTQSSSP